MIDVVIPTYNGENYIEELLDSVIHQTFEGLNIYVGDDGSQDKTVALVSEYLNTQKGNLALLQNTTEEHGVVKNISRLLERTRSDYIAFCDQDDVWSPDKLRVTFNKLQEMEDVFGKQTPLLVHTDSKVVDKELNVISESFWAHQNIKPQGRESLNRLLVQNVITGCTVMINKPLYDLALPIPDDVIMHDWWLALVASAFGKIGHVAQSTMLYRQHGFNEIGATRWSPSFVLKSMLGNDGQVREGILNAQRQARAFLNRYRADLPDDMRKIVECYAHLDERPYYEKVYLLIKHRLFKAGTVRNLGLWAHI